MPDLRRLGSTAAIIGLAAVGVAATPHDAKAWWRGGYHVGVWGPPVVVEPPPVYYPPPRVVYGPPPPAYYPAPRRVWVPPHWQGPYWIRGHWS